MRPAADQRLVKKAQAQNWVMTGELEVLSISLPCSEQAVKAPCNVRQ